ncbi:MAG: hypothetical protein VW405_21235 [Rhodospirillaceae bacterium]|jgi:hypothetical protein
MKRKIFLAGVLCGAVARAGQAAAQRAWSVAPAEPSGLAAEISKMDEETGAAPENGLPDGRVARSATGSISAAWHVLPTERYAHGILGGAVADANGGGRPDLALPSADRRGLRIVSLESAWIVLLAHIPLPAAIDEPVAAAGSRPDLQFFVGLDNGQVFRIAQVR